MVRQRSAKPLPQFESGCRLSKFQSETLIVARVLIISDSVTLAQIVSELATKTDTKSGTVADIDTRIAQANGRLKAGKVGVRIIRRGDTLSLRATLPPKPGVVRKDNRWAIALGVPANAAGVQLAERKARLLGAELQNGSFDWGSGRLKVLNPSSRWATGLSDTARNLRVLLSLKRGDRTITTFSPSCLLTRR